MSVPGPQCSSDFWGQPMSVTGVLTGQDLLNGLQNRKLGDAILLPDAILKHGETRFLGNVTGEHLAAQLKTPILPVSGIDGLILGCINGMSELVEMSK
ncbi:DUF512 domain-containing protein [Laspinema sp. D2d]|uniref:DUF512 domain-containing protein n=1 Tax=Laspinema sp. D2d TaxID=2953686 RepID=UPI0021BB69DA|nr:DUF512 domain-containing protein [Laspinema sp. D2d]